MKRFLIIMVGFILVGCTPNTVQQDNNVHIKAMSGPTGMGLAPLLLSDNKSNNTYEYSIETGAQPIVSALMKGEVDIATLPANVAATLYNQGANIEVLAINTLGVLSIVSTDESIDSVDDLKGKTIVASGKDTTPDYVLTYILESNGLQVGTDVIVEWKSEQNEVVAALAANNYDIAMLPQPFATVALNKVEGLHIVLDLTHQWDLISDDSSLITGVVVVNKTFADNNPNAVEQFLKDYQKSVNSVNNEIESSSTLIGKLGIVDEKIAQLAIPYCNIVCISGKEMVPLLNGYLTVLLNANPQSVGNKLPDNNFYYGH